MEVRVKMKDKTQEEVLLIGSENPTRSFVYSKKEPKIEVFLASDSLKTDLNKDVYDLRDKTVVEFDEKEIRKVEIVNNEKKILCQKQGDEWTLVEPVKARGDGGEIDGVVTKLKNLKVKQFIDEEPKELSGYGLDTPQAGLTVWVGKDETQKGIILGKKDENKKALYARRQSGGNVFMLGEDIMEVVNKDKDALRDKRVITFGVDKVQKFAIKYPDTLLTCVKDEKKNWKLASPADAKADEVHVSTWLWDVDGIKAKEFIDSPSDLAQYGLDLPEAEISVWTEGAEAPKMFIVGKTQEDKAGFYAKPGAENFVCLIDTAEKSKILKKVYDLQDRRLLAFEDEQVTKIQVKYPQTNLILAKKKKWQIEQDGKGEVIDMKISDLLWAIKDTRWEELVNEPSSDGKTYGFDKPTVEVTLWKEKEQEIGSFTVGSKITDEDFYYARLKGDARIFQIESEILNKLPKTSADLK
jgi:hypothetical protein